jgi:hypothetical protein
VAALVGQEAIELLKQSDKENSTDIPIDALAHAC